MPPKKKAPSNGEVGLKKTDKTQRSEYNKLKKTVVSLLEAGEDVLGNQRTIHDRVFGSKGQSPFTHKSISNQIKAIDSKWREGNISSGG